MKILATFDETPFSEAILPQLNLIAGLPNAEFTLLSVAHEPDGKLRKRGRPRPIVFTDAMGRGTPMVIDAIDASYAENKIQAIERRMSELEDYLLAMAHRLPHGASCQVEAHVSDDVAGMIVDRAREEQIDVIVMATHSRGPLRQALFGSTTEAVVRSGVAPVLLVHPKA
jgi:nucleotide-binding universal stress UspA family protein